MGTMGRLVQRERFLGRIAVIACVFATAYWQWDAGWLYPLRVLLTLVHEFGHGFTAILTGGSIDRIEIDGLGGRCWVLGGWRWAVIPAGYLGSMAAGCGIILLACRARIHRFVSLALGCLLVAVTLLYVRTGDGLAYGTLVGAALASSGWWLSEDANGLLLSVIGAMNCLGALFGLKYIATAHCYNDAILFSKEILPLPPIVWASSWAALAMACLILTLRVSLKPS